METKRDLQRKQMSEAVLTAAFLAMSGGLQDAYTYFVRGKVFANAQTGNVVLMSGHILSGEWVKALGYLFPLLAFGLGVFAAEMIRRKHRRPALHWRQVVLAGEIVILFGVGFLPLELNALANAVVSFTCAMQVQTFRKLRGNVYASTMCVGNFRSGIDLLCAGLSERNREALVKSGRYFAVILFFAFGAGLGRLLSEGFGLRTIWVSCALLLVSFLLLFGRTEVEK